MLITVKKMRVHCYHGEGSEITLQLLEKHNLQLEMLFHAIISQYYERKKL